jgi:ribonuclease H / adenosylcobalamin/alpha-ribazole phosphatase
MTGTIHLVRHAMHEEVGRRLSGRSDVPLNEAGLRQARGLASRFSGAPIASLHCSPRLRARQTIEPLARACMRDVQIASALDEIDFGRFAGQSFDALDDDADWRAWNERRNSARCPGGETMAEAVDRALSYLSALADDDLPALCVTHCDIIRGIVARVQAIGFDRLFELGCDPGSVTTLEKENSRWRVAAGDQATSAGGGNA